MPGLVRTAFTALGVFAGTNVDDLLVLTVLFLAARTGRPRRWTVVLGQAAGFTVLLGASALIAIGLLAVPEQWVRLLGLIPLVIGAYGLWRAARLGDGPPPPLASGLLAIAGLTIANGADNLSVYTPLLRALTVDQAVITVVVFYLGVALWCVAGLLLSAHKKAAAALDRIRHWLGPAVFVAIGVTILLGVL